MQSAFDGVSMRYSFDDAEADGARKTQFYSMLGSRGIWHDGWKAVTTHPDDRRLEPLQRRHLGALPHRRRPLGAARPGGRATRRSCASSSTCGSPRRARNDAFPLDDRSALEIILTPRPLLAPPRDRYVYFPDTAEVPEQQAVNVRNRSFAIGALVDIPAPGAQGVLFAHGARFGGHALYVKDNRLHYVNSFVGMFEQKIVATEDLPTGENLILSASFDKDGEDPPGVATGHPVALPRRQEGRRGPDQDPAGLRSRSPARVCASDATAASRSPTTTPATSPYRFTGGTIKRVAVDVSGEPYVDLEREAAAMLARE